MDICVVGTQNSLYEVLQLKQKFQKSQVVAGKTPLFVIGPFCTSHSVCVIIWLLTEQFCMEMLRFQSQYFQLKSSTLVFLKRARVFQKIYFKFKVLKTFKISSDCHIKTYRSVKCRAILKILSTVFCKNLMSFCWLQQSQYFQLKSGIPDF